MLNVNTNVTTKACNITTTAWRINNLEVWGCWALC